MSFYHQDERDRAATIGCAVILGVLTGFLAVALVGCILG